MESKYIFFWKTNEEYGWMSQWYYSPFEATIKIGGQTESVVFPTAEHWMMVQKALLFGDEEIARKVLEKQEVTSKHMAEVKALGRRVQEFDEGTWVAKREEIVREGNMHKFEQNVTLRQKLIKTGTAGLVETSPRDRVWGIGFGAVRAEERVEKWGLNLLGRALEEVRAAVAGTTGGSAATE
ncbi:hypothetical protein F5887DRAFT_975355 [Amanita rubescens]|nr:hypothetical protein F5887DRAFT_975355 [Amanita rubescens]